MTAQTAETKAPSLLDAGARPRRPRRRVRRHRHQPALHAENRARLHRPAPDAGARRSGALSLILWTLFVITTIKYVNFAMRIDNDGEGGIIALMSLLGVKKGHRPAIVAVGLFGAALIYGDGAITPAISVLSALEGVEQVAPSLEDLCAAGGGRHSAGAVRRAADGDGQNRPRLRAGDAGLVRRHGAARASTASRSTLASSPPSIPITASPTFSAAGSRAFWCLAACFYA